jgi:hypothetical protein
VAKAAQGLKGMVLSKKFVLPIKSLFFTFIHFYFLLMVLHNVTFNVITFFKCGSAGPSQQYKRASNIIQDPLPRWILTIFKLKFDGGNLFSPTTTRAFSSYGCMFGLETKLLQFCTKCSHFFENIVKK